MRVRGNAGPGFGFDIGLSVSEANIRAGCSQPVFDMLACAHDLAIGKNGAHERRLDHRAVHSGERARPGGMATVFEAHHAVDAHPIALKILRPDIVADPSFIAAFGDEVRAAAKLDHACVTTVYDHGLITNEEAGAATGFAGAPWLAMELG